jgi:hypothetical protein
MSNILRFDQFREGYIFENQTSYRENISSLKYLENRYQFEDINESVLSWAGEAWDDLSGGLGSFWNGLKTATGTTSDGDWSLENILHTVADVGGIVGDFIYPGVGAAIDIFHAGVYFLQSYFVEDPEKRSEYVTFGMITLLFAHPALNPIQFLFKAISKPFRELLKRLSSGASAKVISEYLSKNQSLKKFVDLVSKNFDTVEKELGDEISSGGSKSWMRKFEDWLKERVDKFPFLKTVLSNIKGFFKRMLDMALWPFRKLKQIIAGSSSSFVKYGVKIPLKVIKFVSQNTLGRLYKAFLRRLPGFPRTKKIGLFDNLFEKFSALQSEKGIIKSSRGGSNKLFRTGGVKMNSDEFVLMDLNKGSNKARVVVGRGSGPGTNSAMRGELKTFWEKQFDDAMSSGKYDKPVYPSGALRGRELSGSDLDAYKRYWVDTQVNNSFIKEIDKSDFVQTFYKTHENAIKLNAALFKPFAALYKFLLGPIFDSKDSEENASEQDEEMTIEDAKQLDNLTDEQIEEMMDNIEGSGSDLMDENDPTYGDLTSEERSDIAEVVRTTEIDRNSLLPSQLDINTVVWKILDSIDSSIDLPADENMKFADYSWPLSEFQRNNNLKDSGRLDQKTIEALYEKTGDPDFRNYLESYLETLPAENESQDLEEEIKDEEEKNKSDKKERRERRKENIKSYARWLVGKEE